MRRRSLMKAAILSIIAILLTTLSGVSSDQDTGYRILMTGLFHGDEIDSVSKDGWYGLLKTEKGGYILEPVEILAKPCHDPVMNGPGDTTGLALNIEHPLVPLLLIKPPAEWRVGHVPTIFDGREPIKPGESTRLGQYILTALGQITDEGHRHPGDLLILDYQVKLHKHASSEPAQTLVEYDRSVYESLTTLLWAGDLDRDGQTDYLLDIRNHYNVSHYALFLSSEAGPNDYVKLVAELRKVGC